MKGRLVPLAGQSQGTVPARTRARTGDAAGAMDTKSSGLDRLLTLKDVATFCQVSYWTARGWVESGKLPVVRLPGRLVRVRPDVLAAFLEQCR